MTNKPTIVCLCGSARFPEAFQKAQLEETLAGKIVLTVGCNMKTDTEAFSHLPTDTLSRIRRDLDILHLRKIDLADEVLILNVDGYIGESTRRELDYAKYTGKRVRFLEPNSASMDDFVPKALGREVTFQVVACPHCRKVLDFPIDRRVPEGADIGCNGCGNIFRVEWQ
jgi:hypothetical protein